MGDAPTEPRQRSIAKYPPVAGLASVLTEVGAPCPECGLRGRRTR